MLPPALNNALQQIEIGRFSQAEPLLRRYLQRTPRDVYALRLMSSVMRGTSRIDQAVFFLKQAAAAAPTDADVLCDLSEVLTLARQHAEAVTAAQRAVDLYPNLAGTHMRLGAALEAAQKPVEAEREYRRAIELDQTLAIAHCHLADLHLKFGEPEAALLRARETARYSDRFQHQATVAVFSNYASGIAPAQIRAEHVETVRRMELVGKPPLPPLASLNIDKDPERRLRVAFLSPDFLEHSVAYFAEPIIQHIDREKFELFAIYPSQKSDKVTARIRGRCSKFHVLPEPNEAEVIKLLRQDKIDIAIDLAGYTASTALWPLRQRVCPLQLTYIGYPNTTAIPTVDARLVDAVTDPSNPPGSADALCTERLVRLGGCFLCYNAPTDIPAVAPSPAAADPARGVCFGSFNFLGKCGEKTRAHWARILKAVPNSTLLLKDGVFESDAAKARIRDDFARRGVDPSRLELIAKTASRNDHLGQYAKVDIGLDPFPYNGTTTTCEAMLMGVPVVTVAGETHVSRVGASLLTAVGLSELVARNEDESVRICTELAGDRARLAKLRIGMRERMLGSALCDQKGHADRFGNALRGLWREWCGSRVHL